MIKTLNWTPPKNWLRIKTIDLHTGGEPLRVYLDGLPEIPGKTILEKRRFFRNNYDHIRTGTMFEPRGHADMYGAVITEATTEDADFGTFFLHNEGYSTMCGHAIIALTKLIFLVLLALLSSSRIASAASLVPMEVKTAVAGK